MDNENEVNIRERLTAVEQSTKSAHRRIDNIEELTQSVKTLVVETKYLKEDIIEVKDTVTTMKNQPSKILMIIITALITVIVSGIGGYVINNILQGGF